MTASAAEVQRVGTPDFFRCTPRRTRLLYSHRTELDNNAALAMTWSARKSSFSANVHALVGQAELEMRARRFCDRSARWYRPCANRVSESVFGRERHAAGPFAKRTRRGNFARARKRDHSCTKGEMSSVGARAEGGIESGSSGNEMDAGEFTRIFGRAHLRRVSPFSVGGFVSVRALASWQILGGLKV